MRVVRVDRGKNHWYVDQDAGNVRVPGVTGLTGGGLPKDALINWAAAATAGYAVDNWDRLAALPLSERLSEMNKGRYAVKDKASNKGTEVHTLAQRLIAGERVVIPDHLTGYVEACVRFLDEFAFEAEFVECLVYNETHYYSGQLDIIGTVVLPDMPDYDHIPRDEHGRSRGLFDWKTSKSGIFGDVALQLAPYRHAEFIQTDPKDPDTAEPMVEVDFAAGIHIHRQGYEVVPLDTSPEVFRDFLYVKEVARIADKEAMRALVGEPILPPFISAYRLSTTSDQPAAAAPNPKLDAMLAAITEWRGNRVFIADEMDPGDLDLLELAAAVDDWSEAEKAEQRGDASEERTMGEFDEGKF